MKPKNDFVIRIPLKMYLSIGNPTSRDVFMAVYSFTDNGSGECFASQRQIAARSGYSQPTVKEHLPRLVKSGHLKVIGNRSVRGGSIPIYRISDRELITKPRKVISSREKVIGKPPTETIKETAAIAVGIPINEKPPLARTETWSQTLSAYQKSVLKYQARGQAVSHPKALFLKILKDTAHQLGDHKYLVSVISDADLKAMIEGMAHTGLPSDSYYLEAKRRGLV